VKPKNRRNRGCLVLAAMLALLFLEEFRGLARADVYYWKDTDGVFHFTNSPRPDAMPFLVDEPVARLSNDEVSDHVPDSGDYDNIIGKLAKRFGVEKTLVKAVIRAESGFNRMAISSAGARGLMQLMPETAREYGVRNIYDAEQNIEGGIRHLRLLLERHRNNLPRVLAAYNAGSDVVDRYKGIPPIAETEDYVARVLRYRQQYLKRERMRAVASSS
jgi:soluble lytic murein transglycosylase-like protein